MVVAIQRLLYFMRNNSLLCLGLFIIGSMSFATILAPVLATHDPLMPSPDELFLPPSAEHFLGTDAEGRDVFSRILYGGRVSLWVGFASVGISLSIGVPLGLVAGYFRGIIDECIMRFVDIMLCFPSFFLILAVVAILDANLTNIMVVIGLTSWMHITRLVRAETLSLRERDFILSARLSGAPSHVILFRHILPNAIAPIPVAATLGIAGAILTESVLSFLGIGVQHPFPSWGNILIEGKQALGYAWWLSLFPGLAILVTVLGYNILGDSLRDTFDPRLTRT